MHDPVEKYTPTIHVWIHPNVLSETVLEASCLLMVP